MAVVARMQKKTDFRDRRGLIEDPVPRTPASPEVVKENLSFPSGLPQQREPVLQDCLPQNISQPASAVPSSAGGFGTVSKLLS